MKSADSATNNSWILGIFAKQPIAGQVKTRLAQATSAARAERVAQAFLEDSLDRFSRIPAKRTIVFAPASAAEFFTRLADGRFDCTPQSEGNLGDRLKAFFATARSRGFARIVAVGADSPTLPIEYIERAFTFLATHDVVIGPAFDGGYYLLGCSAKEYPIFAGIPWSTSGVMETTVRTLEMTDARLTLLPPWYDVDTAEDWAMLRGHVLAMRRAGLDPGVPRVERMMSEPDA